MRKLIPVLVIIILVQQQTIANYIPRSSVDIVNSKNGLHIEPNQKHSAQETSYEYEDVESDFHTEEIENSEVYDDSWEDFWSYEGADKDAEVQKQTLKLIRWKI